MTHKANLEEGSPFQRKSRRAFLSDVGRGMLVASVGASVASELNLGSAFAGEIVEPLNFGPLEDLVCYMQETPVDKLISGLGEKLKSGVSLRKMIQAGALANARTFGGEDYVGFHTVMALGPAMHMAEELPEPSQPLPVFKVLYRNTNRIQERGGRKAEVLHAVAPAKLPQGAARTETMVNAIHHGDVNEAEQTFALIAQDGVDEALNQLLYAVQEDTEVHRVVLPYRAWDLMELIGRDQAQTLLRQSVRYCVKAENYPSGRKSTEARSVLPAVLEQHHLLDRTPGNRKADDKWVEELSETLFKSSPEQAAHAAGAALAEGFSPDNIGEAISLAANQLVLRDLGRSPREESPGKPPGSVHGDGIGVHACDSAGAWRNLARVSNARNTFACLILGAYQVALDRAGRGGDFLNWQPLPYKNHLAGLEGKDAESLLRLTAEAIRQNQQGHAAAAVHRYGEAGFAPRPVFDLLLRFAVSEDGALHAEKYYRTVSEEFASTRPAYRWRQLVALARVTASEFGRPAPGVLEAREILKIKESSTA